MSKTQIEFSAEIVSKNEAYQPVYEQNPLTSPRWGEPPKMELVTTLMLKVSSYQTDTDGAIASKDGDLGTVTITVNGTEALAALRSGTRMLVHLEPLPIVPATKDPRMTKKVERPDDITFIRPNEQWRGDDGRQQNANDQAQRDGGIIGYGSGTHAPSGGGFTGSSGGMSGAGCG